MLIGVDIDDVLFPWFDKAHAACEARGITNGVSPSQWQCWLDYGCTEDDWLAVMREVTLDGTLYSGDPYPRAREALQWLADTGHTIHLVTARGFFQHGELIRKHTIDWVHDNDLPHNALSFTKDKTAIRFDVAVDDSASNVAAYRDANIAACLIDAPHNQEFSHPWRVESFADFAEQVIL